MPKVSTYNITGAQTGEIELNDSVFGVEVNEAVMRQAVLRQLANQRLGTHSTKLAASFAVVAESLGNKKEPAGPV